MPFDFIKHKHYSINYSDLFQELNAQEILNNKNVQVEYLKLWMKTLEEHDKVITNQLNTKESIAKLVVLLEKEPEIFQLPIYHQNNEILIHFRASVANQIISESKAESQFIPLVEFTKKNSRIRWTPVNTNVDLFSNSAKPIIMVPFLSGQYNYLVIDGNHRITSKTKNNIDDIYAFSVAEQSVIDQSLFSSSFDKFYYIMYNELNHMANETHLNKANALQLVKKSYLTDETFKFL